MSRRSSHSVMEEGMDGVEMATQSSHTDSDEEVDSIADRIMGTENNGATPMEQSLRELINTFWEYHNCDKLDVLNEDLYYLCSKYTEKHKKVMNKWKRKKKEQEVQDGEEYWMARRHKTITERVRECMEDPRSSITSKIVHIIVFALIIAATAALCLETLPRWNPDVFPKYTNMWFAFEAFVTACFTLELLIRFIVSESKLRFFKSFYNLVDIVAILPFYIEVIFSKSSSLRVVRLIRLTRIFRVLKITRNSGTSGLVLSRVIRMSAPALVIPAFFLLLGLIIISSIIYYVERGDYDTDQMKFLIQDADCESRPKYLLHQMDCPKIESQFVSIPDTLWWAIVTMTTVGYGDIVPVTRWGKFVASIGMFCGIIFLAMPLTIVGGNFAKCINDLLEERKVARRAALEAELDKQRDELDATVRTKQLNFQLIEKELDTLSAGLRALLPALQVCNPKLHRHVDHFLEIARDIRNHTSMDIVQNNILKHNMKIHMDSRRAGAGSPA